MPGKATDPPGWRLAHDVWDAVRHDSWRPVLKLAFLAVVGVGLSAVVVLLMPWLSTVALACGACVTRLLSRPRRSG
ncbi:hypothetical protein [Actinokineospora enzanensis]|uniref:hypothetical protein n=1 Tax=Actinokineospora enzanensis TaxID=155975 RepID=UPI00037D9508|nr:hypothetical protein [Actinokineospora enzanensis]